MKSAAILTVFRAPAMTPSGARRVAQWLRRQASYLERHRRLLTMGRFTARYLYNDRLTPTRGRKKGGKKK